MSEQFGCKASIGVDQDSEIIRKAKLTSADVHDVLVSYEVIVGDQKSVCDDKCYHSKSLLSKLKKAGIEDKLMYSAANGHPPTHWQKWFNKAVLMLNAAWQYETKLLLYTGLLSGIEEESEPSSFTSDGYEYA